MAQQQKPTNLVEAEQKATAAKLAADSAKSKRALRDAMEDLEFWSSKAAMLDVMFRKGMIGGAA